MSKGSNPTNVTTTTSAEPSEFIRPYYTQAIDAAQDLYQSALPSYFPNNTYVNTPAETEAALALATNRATAGNPLLNQSQTEVGNILSGNYLSPTTNPYAKALYDQMAGDVTAGVQSQFSSAGRLGSSANQETLARSLGNLANEVYGDQYNRERANMVNATQLAPQLGEMDYNDITRLAQVGDTREAIEQTKLQDAMARFDYEQQKPYIKLNQYLGALGANVPMNTLSTQPYFRNTGAGLLGGAMAGGQLAGMMNATNPMAYMLGGGLLGGFA